MTQLPNAGWYADPYGTSPYRWWDGFQWTGHVHDPQTAVAPAPTPRPATQPVPRLEPVSSGAVAPASPFASVSPALVAPTTPFESGAPVVEPVAPVASEGRANPRDGAPTRDAGDATLAGTWVAWVGGVLMIVGCFFPWGSISIGSLGITTIHENAFQLGPNLGLTLTGPLTITVGVITVLICAARLALSHLPRWVWAVVLVLGVAVMCAAFVQYAWLSNPTPLSPNEVLAGSIGSGYWLVVVGGAAAVFGAAAMYTPRSRLGARLRRLIGRGAGQHLADGERHG